MVGDEINRASPKTQSALLECMEERQVTVDGTTYALRAPFMVIATQNPVEMEGTYPLPEAQRDRFTARISIGYPRPRAELEMLDVHGGASPLDDLQPGRARAERRARADRRRCAGCTCPTRSSDYVDRPGRRHPDVTRAAARRLAAGHPAPAARRRASAALDGRDYVLPDDVQALAVPGARAPAAAHGARPSWSAHLPEQVVDRIVARCPCPPMSLPEADELVRRRPCAGCSAR